MIRHVRAALLALLGLSPMAAAQDANAIVAKFRANMEALPFYTCEYDETRAKAETIEDAFAGKWLPRQPGDKVFPSKARVRWVQDGKNVHHAIIAERLQPDSGFISMTQLANGVDSLSYLPGDARPGNERGNVNFCGRPASPWGEQSLLSLLCGGGANSLWNQAAATTKPIEIHSAPHRGVECVWLTIHDPMGKRTQFVLDPVKGHFPRCIIWQDQFGDEIWRQEVTEIRECSKGRYFPMRILGCSPKTLEHWSVSECKVTKLDVDARPERESLMLTLPRNTYVMDVQDSRTDRVTPYVVLKSDLRIHPEEIPKLRDLFATKPMPEEPPPTEREAPPPGFPWRKWAPAAGGVAILLAAAIWRRRSKAL